MEHVGTIETIRLDAEDAEHWLAGDEPVQAEVHRKVRAFFESGAGRVEIVQEGKPGDPLRVFKRFED